MTEFLVLSLEQVESLFPVNRITGSRGRRTSGGHAIEPIALESGIEFILPLEVLDDPKHAEFIANMKTHASEDKRLDLKAEHLKRDVSESELKKPETEDPKGEAAELIR